DGVDGHVRGSVFCPRASSDFDWFRGGTIYRAPTVYDNDGENVSAMPSKPASRTTARILRSKIIYKGPVFGIRRDEIIEPGGLRVTREVITHPGSVVVLPVFPDGRILMIRQYRHATRQFLWELVAGRIDEGENPRKAAARELIEETGYRAKRFHVFLDIFPTPGFLEERMYILLAEDLTAGVAEPEEDERITAQAFTHGEIEQMIRRNKIRDAKSVAGILYYLRFLVRS
ncbi:MAG: NUDIX hydrolase, partial [Thermoplasmata archaeon]